MELVEVMLTSYNNYEILSLSKKNMIPQTTVLVILNSILFLALLLATSIGNIPQRVYSLMALFVFLAPSMIIHIYSINCMVVGRCDLWGWVLTIVSSISILIATVSVIYLTVKSKNDEKRTDLVNGVKHDMQSAYQNMIPRVPGLKFAEDKVTAMIQ